MLFDPSHRGKEFPIWAVELAPYHRARPIVFPWSDIQTEKPTVEDISLCYLCQRKEFADSSAIVCVFPLIQCVLRQIPSRNWVCIQVQIVLCCLKQQFQVQTIFELRRYVVSHISMNDKCWYDLSEQEKKRTGNAMRRKTAYEDPV